jgi:hypothetical protein
VAHPEFVAAFFGALARESATIQVEFFTYSVGALDDGNQLIDAAPQRLTHRRRIISDKLIPQVNSLTRRLNLCRKVNLRLNLNNKYLLTLSERRSRRTNTSN